VEWPTTILTALLREGSLGNCPLTYAMLLIIGLQFKDSVVALL
jgi:hypothetical protein